MAECGHKVESLLGDLTEDFSNANPKNYSKVIKDALQLVDKQSEWVDRCRDAADKAGLEKAKCCLQSIVDAAIAESIIEGNKDKVQYHIEDVQGLAAFGNDDAIRVIFSNIITNAVEAMRDGGRLKIKAYASTRDKAFREEMSWFQNWDAEYVPIVFEDNGVGMQPEQKDLLGTDFTTKKDHHGLGTVICMALLKSQNGLMEVDTKLNQGTTVIIALPPQGGTNESFESIWA